MVDKKLPNFATQLLFEEFINQEILLIVSEVFHKTSKKLADKNKEQDNSLRCFDKCYKEKKQKLKETEETLKDAIAAKEQLKEELNKQKNVEVRRLDKTEQFCS